MSIAEISATGLNRRNPTASDLSYGKKPRSSRGAGKSVLPSGSWNRLRGNCLIILLKTHSDRGRLPGEGA